MRILHTISSPWWNACSYYAVSIARIQSDHGHSVYFAGVPSHLSTQKAYAEQLNVLPVDFAAKDPVKWTSSRSRLKRFLFDHRIEIINSHMPEDHLLAGSVAFFNKIPLIRTIGDVRSPRDNIFNACLFSKTDHCIFSSDSNLIRYFSLWPMITQKSSIIHGGIDLNRFVRTDTKSALAQRLDIEQNKIWVGLVGRFSKTKDHLTFLRAAMLCRDRFDAIHFIISGTDAGLKREDIEKMVHNLNMETAVTIIDRYDPVNELLSALDIGVVASKDSEAICRIAMEYMSIGIPMVVTDINVLPEMVRDGHNGFIVPVQDAFSMSESIVRLATDDKLRQRISEINSVEAQQRFSMSLWYEQTLRVYKKVLNQVEV